MENSLKQFEKEYMKNAMLKHEETFRQQVSELHRLYKVQKLLMRDMRDAQLTGHVQASYSHGNNKICPRQSGYIYRDQSRTTKSLNLELPAEEYIDENNGDKTQDHEGCDIDLTLSIGRSRRRKEDPSITSDSAASFSSSSTDSGGENFNLHNWGLNVPSASYPSQKNVFGMKGAIRLGSLKQPSWHRQCLSLNMA